MTTSNAENQESTEATATAKEPEAPKKAPVAPRRAHVASSKAKSGKKPTASKKGAKGAKRAKAPNRGARQGSKTEKVLDLLKRSGGASLKEIMKATDWQAHSVRGFLSGTLGKKMGLSVVSKKDDGGERVYSVKA
jgi:uncharacterized protein DUF3489